MKTFLGLAVVLGLTYGFAGEAHAKAYKPSDFAFDCHGSFVITDVTDVLQYQKAQPSRAPNPPLYWVTIANVKLKPIGVSKDCELMGSKYHQAVEVGGSLSGSVVLAGEVASTIDNIKNKVHDFKIEQKIYGANPAGYLPLFPKYAMLEYLDFQTNFGGGKWQWNGLEVDFIHQVDSFDVYGIKDISKLPVTEKLAVAKSLADDIVTYQLDPVAQEPFYDALLWAKPFAHHAENLDLEEESYLHILLGVFNEMTKSKTEISKETGLFGLARQMNHFISYELTAKWKTVGDLKLKMKLAKSTPLLFSHDLVFAGYEWTGHLSPQEIEEVITEFAYQVKTQPDAIKKAQYFNAIKAIYEENLDAKTKYAPQYFLTDKAIALIEEVLASEANH